MIRLIPDVPCDARDGVMLSNDVYLPDGPGPFATLLCRTPYDNQDNYYADWAVRFAEAGFAAVIQDCRGRYDSDGVWRPYVVEGNDGYDSVAWLTQQPWCDGNIGTFGFSYVGFDQLLTALEQPSGLRATLPIGNQEDNYGHIWCDGILQLEAAVNYFRLGRRSMQYRAGSMAPMETMYRTVPLTRALDPVGGSGPYQEFLAHPTFDDYWKVACLQDRYDRINVPALQVTGWYDNLVHEQFKIFTGLRSGAGTSAARTQTRILVGPWTHYDIGKRAIVGVDFGPDAEVDLPGLHVRWYRARLAGVDTGIDAEPPLKLFVMGTNKWRFASEWPIPGTTFANFFFHSGGRAATSNGDGSLSRYRPAHEPPDTYEYDPDNPVPTVGGFSQFDGGPKERSDVERRPDVLVYQTDPLDADVDVIGPVSINLFASTTADDTDFAGTLVDVDEQGRRTIICEGMTRGRFRQGFDREIPLTPGEVYEFRLSLWETGMTFKKGHRIALEITSSNFPRLNRNLNWFEPIGSGTRIRRANQQVFHNSGYPSHLVLPLAPRS